MCPEWLLLSHSLFTLPSSPLPLLFLSSSSLCVQFFVSSRPSNIFLTVREPWPASRSQKKDARPESPTRLANYSRVVLCGVNSMLSLGPKQVQSACVLLPRFMFTGYNFRCNREEAQLFQLGHTQPWKS